MGWSLLMSPPTGRTTLSTCWRSANWPQLSQFGKSGRDHGSGEVGVLSLSTPCNTRWPSRCGTRCVPELLLKMRRRRACRSAGGSSACDMSWSITPLWINQPMGIWDYVINVIHPHFACKASIKALNLPILHGVVDRQLPPDRGESSPVQPTSFSWGSTCNETESASIYGGFGSHWGYPQSSSIFMGFSLINHAALG